MGIKKVCSKLFRNHRTTQADRPVQKWRTCSYGHWYDETECESCPYCKEGYPKVVDSLLLYQTSTLKCPNCNAILSVFSLPNIFGDDTGYYCEKCHFTGYYGGTRCEGQSWWQVISEGNIIE